MPEPPEAKVRAVTQVNPIRPRYADVGGQPFGEGEARCRERSNEHEQLSGLPGWLGAARIDR